MSIESYPDFGWATGTNFDVADEQQLCGTHTSSPTKHATSSPSSQPTHSPSVPPQSSSSYLNVGCAPLTPTFCPTYCKDNQQDDCGRSVCHGDSHDALNPCPSPGTPQPTAHPSSAPFPSPVNPSDIYYNDGCAVFGDTMDSFCHGFNGGYCKFWQSDGCGRSVCKGDSHANLNPVC